MWQNFDHDNNFAYQGSRGKFLRLKIPSQGACANNKYKQWLKILSKSHKITNDSRYKIQTLEFIRRKVIMFEECIVRQRVHSKTT